MSGTRIVSCRYASLVLAGNGKLLRSGDIEADAPVVGRVVSFQNQCAGLHLLGESAEEIKVTCFLDG